MIVGIIRKHKECIKYIILFLVLCVFFKFVPYTDDDLRWGSQTGLDRFLDGFEDYGGRYIGYIIVMGLTRSEVFKVLFMSAVVTLLAFLVRYITNLQTASYVLLLSVMTAPLPLFRSTIGWVSGFANYVTSICFTLVYIAYIVYFERKSMNRNSIGMMFLLCLLGAVNTLLVEHFTIYNVLLGIFIVILFAVRHKCIFIQFIGYVFGCVWGAIMMFSNTAYHNVLTGNDSYRAVGNTESIITIGSGLAKICKFGYMDNIILNAVILIALSIIVFRYQSCLTYSKQSVVKACLFVNLLQVIGSCFVSKIFDGVSTIGIGVYLAIIVMSLLSVLALVIIAMLFAKYYVCFRRILFLLVSIVLINAPFLVANPVNPRVFFGTYILFTILFCILLKELCHNEKLISEKDVKNISKVGVMVGAFFYIAVFSLIYKADRERLLDIQQQVADGETTVVMSAIPYEQFVHDITLYEKWELEEYKKFYHLPKDLKLVAGENVE